MPPEPRCDVAIIGSGLAGALLATVLARHGQRVVMLEAGSHPRFAIGESTVPEYSALCRVLAAYFDVPELNHIGHFPALIRHVSPASGIKRNFTFGVHREGQDVPPESWVQFPTLTTPLGPDAHVYRPDLDAWLTALAVRYGVDYRERTAVTGIDLREDGVGLDLGGRRLEARYLVDAAGFRSPLAERLGLRQDPPALRTDSRTIFTHAVGVADLGDVCAGRFPLPSPPDQGTLHHLFDGGWFWVIPFGNHAAATNPVCSIGLTLDRRRHPDNDLDPAEEFFAFARRFPTARRQLEGARPVRGWVKTGRLQYRSRQVTGPRWSLMPHSAYFVDPLFSSGMTQTLHAVRDLATALLPALREDDLDPARFARLEEAAQRAADLTDEVVHAAYVAFRSPALWNAYHRLWAVANFQGSTGYVRLHLNYLASGDRAVLEQMHAPPYRGPLASDHPRVRALLRDGARLLREVEAGSLDEDAAVAALYDLLGRQDWIPPRFRVTDPEHRYVSTFTVAPLMATVLWGKRHAPPDFRDRYYDIGPVFFWELTRALLGQAVWFLLAFLRVFRDAHVTRGRS